MTDRGKLRGIAPDSLWRVERGASTLVNLHEDLWVSVSAIVAIDDVKFPQVEADHTPADPGTVIFLDGREEPFFVPLPVADVVSILRRVSEAS